MGGERADGEHDGAGDVGEEPETFAVGAAEGGGDGRALASDPRAVNAHPYEERDDFAEHALDEGENTAEDGDDAVGESGAKVVVGEGERGAAKSGDDEEGESGEEAAESGFEEFLFSCGEDAAELDGGQEEGSEEQAGADDRENGEVEGEGGDEKEESELGGRESETDAAEVGRAGEGEHGDEAEHGALREGDEEAGDAGVGVRAEEGEDVEIPPGEAKIEREEESGGDGEDEPRGGGGEGEEDGIEARGGTERAKDIGGEERDAEGDGGAAEGDEEQVAAEETGDHGGAAREMEREVGPGLAGSGEAGVGEDRKELVNGAEADREECGEKPSVREGDDVHVQVRQRECVGENDECGGRREGGEEAGEDEGKRDGGAGGERGVVRGGREHGGTRAWWRAEASTVRDGSAEAPTSRGRPICFTLGQARRGRRAPPSG